MTHASRTTTRRFLALALMISLAVGLAVPAAPVAHADGMPPSVMVDADHYEIIVNGFSFAPSFPVHVQIYGYGNFSRVWELISDTYTTASPFCPASSNGFCTEGSFEVVTQQAYSPCLADDPATLGGMLPPSVFAYSQIWVSVSELGGWNQQSALTSVTCPSPAPLPR